MKGIWSRKHSSLPSFHCQQLVTGVGFWDMSRRGSTWAGLNYGKNFFLGSRQASGSLLCPSALTKPALVIAA